MVDGGEGVELVLKGGSVLGVKEDLVDSGAVGVLAHALAGDLMGGGKKVFLAKLKFLIYILYEDSPQMGRQGPQGWRRGRP